MARPKTDDDLAKELMADEDEPTDMLRFDPQGNLITETDQKKDPKGSAAAE